MQRRELLKISISLCSVLFGAKNQEEAKKQKTKKHIIHFAVLGIMPMPIGTQSKSMNIYSLPTMCQVLGKVLGLLLDRQLMETETILALWILESNKED